MAGLATYMQKSSKPPAAGNGQRKPSLKRLNTSFRNPLLDIVWTELNTKPRELEELRHVSDTLADECIRALRVKAGTDALKALDEYVSAPLGQKDPNGSIMKFKEQIEAVPEWVDWGLVRQGQDVFWKYLVPVIIVLTNYSLAGGFASGKVTDILSCTNYFSTPGGTYQRMLETCKFLLDVMKSTDCFRPFKGDGWSSIVRVRMLHTQVRLRIIAQAKNRPDLYDVEEMGIPINQEDLLGTLCEFSIVVITNLRKMGIHPTPNEVTAYLHLWHVIGYYLGVTGELSNHMVSEEGATALFDSIENHLVDPNEGSAKTAHVLLHSLALRPPLFWPYSLHTAVMRMLVGDKITDSLGFTPTPWYWNMIANCVLFLIRLLHSSTLFSQQRIYLYRTFVPRLYEAFVARRNFVDSHHRKVHCDFTLKYIPHLAEESKED